MILWTLLSAVDVEAKLPNLCCEICYSIVDDWGDCDLHHNPRHCRYSKSLELLNCLRDKCHDTELADAIILGKVGINELIEQYSDVSYD